MYLFNGICLTDNLVNHLRRQMTELSETVTIHHNPLVQRALQHAFLMSLLTDSNGF